MCPRPTDAASAADHQEVEWQFDAIDVRPVERWLLRLTDPVDGEAPSTVPGGLRVEPGRGRQLVDVYLDTEDWGVYRGGYSLRVRRRGREAEATLKALGGASDALRRRREISESLSGEGLAGLPATGGPVGRRVADASGSRPLRPIFEVRTRRRIFRLTREGIPVGEVVVDRTSIPVGAGQEPVRIRRVEVELLGDLAGSEGTGPEDVARFVRAMAEQSALRPAVLSKFEAGLMATGLEPSPPPDLGPTEAGPDSSIGELAFAVLRRGFGTFLSKEPGTRLGDDPEELHDMRVATRRLRAALSVFGDVLPVRGAAIRVELGWLGGLLGAVRDLDVQLGQLGSWMDQAAPADRDALAGLGLVLEEQRAQARREMLDALDSRAHDRLVATATEMLRRGPLRRSAAARAPAVVAGPDRIRDRRRKVRSAARGLAPDGAPDRFHRLRIRAKRLRYTMEFFHDAYGETVDAAVRRLVKVQDLLGEIQDGTVAVARLRALATATDPSLEPATVFAMGQVAERYAERDRGLRRQVPKSLGGLTGKPWKRLGRAMDRMRAGSTAAVQPPAPLVAVPGDPPDAEAGVVA